MDPRNGKKTYFTYNKLNRYRLEITHHEDSGQSIFKLTKDDTLVRSGTCTYCGNFYLWRGILFTTIAIYQKERYKNFTNIIIYYVKPYQNYRINICKIIYAKAKLIKLVQTT